MDVKSSIESFFNQFSAFELLKEYIEYKTKRCHHKFNEEVLMLELFGFYTHKKCSFENVIKETFNVDKQLFLQDKKEKDDKKCPT